MDNGSNNELTEKEETKIKVLAALKKLEIMGDCFAKNDAQIVRDYITDIEAENQVLKEKIVDKYIK